MNHSMRLKVTNVAGDFIDGTDFAGNGGQMHVGTEVTAEGRYRGRPVQIQFPIWSEDGWVMPGDAVYVTVTISTDDPDAA